MISLSRKKDFDLVFRKGRVVKGPLLSLRFLASPDGEMRAGIMVGTNVSKKAVVRNRIRRQAKETLRLSAKDFSASHWLVVVVFPAAALAEDGRIKQEILSLCSRAGII